MSVTGTAAAFLGAGILTTLSKVTVIRLRGSFLAYLSTVTAALDGFAGAMGIGLVTASAFDAGIGSVPTPITEADWDGWMYHKFFACRGAAAGSLVASPGAIAFRDDVDSKAMRKFDEDMRIYCSVELVEVGDSVINFDFDSRVLVKLG